ncbi:MAG: hypothetical protein B6U94_01260, partial [Thermofilum sp. ex4484_79]
CRPAHVNNAESRNWHLRAFLFFKHSVSAALAGFYAAAASAFLRLHAEETLATYHWLTEVIYNVI